MPDLIFFTGDVAFGHDAPERLAEQFDEAGDTDWVDALAGKHGEKAVDVVHDHLRDQTPEWKRLVGRLDVYREFLERYEYKHLLTDPGHLIWHARAGRSRRCSARSRKATSPTSPSP